MGEMARLNVADEKFSKTKALGFSLLRVGNILNGLMVGEVTYFATNSLGVTAAAVSAGVALKTAIDAVTDLPMGAIIDKTHTRFGKARPYVLEGILMWLCTIAIFVAPSGRFAGAADGISGGYRLLPRGAARICHHRAGYRRTWHRVLYRGIFHVQGIQRGGTGGLRGI